MFNCNPLSGCLVYLPMCFLGYKITSLFIGGSNHSTPCIEMKQGIRYIGQSPKTAAGVALSIYKVDIHMRTSTYMRPKL